MRPRLTYANVMATVAVFIALGGASYAALKLPKNSIGAKQLKKNAVTATKIKNNAVTGAKVKESTLATVPTAQTATTANSAAVANSLAPSEAWHEIGAPGEPSFENSWKNLAISPAFEHVGFYKDHEGIVHLKGHATGGTSFNIFHLPPGYRPASGKGIFPLAGCDGGPCSATKVGVIGIAGSGMTEEGVVAVLPGVTNVSFDGISFRAES